MGIWPFRRSRAQLDAERLVEAVTVAGRNPAFFREGGVSDTLEGRFEVMTMIASLALIRLQREPEMEPLTQAFTDRLFRHFDYGLREAGTSDTRVAKRMHQLAGDFYGRLRVYAAAIEARDVQALAEAIGRNTGATETAPMADYMLSLAAAQHDRPGPALLELDSWPPLAG